MGAKCLPSWRNPLGEEKEGKWGKSSSGMDVYAKGGLMSERGSRHGIMPPRHVSFHCSFRDKILLDRAKIRMFKGDTYINESPPAII